MGGAGLDCAIVNPLTKSRKQTRTDIMASSEELNGRALLGGNAGEGKADAAILLPSGVGGQAPAQIKITACQPRPAAPPPRPSAPPAPPPHPPAGSPFQSAASPPHAPPPAEPSPAVRDR